MGQSREIAGADPSLAALLARLAQAGQPSALLMIDNQLVSPKLPPPTEWREARLKTPAGMVTLKRTATGITLTIFGNADPSLLDGVTLALQNRPESGSWRPN